MLTSVLPLLKEGVPIFQREHYLETPIPFVSPAIIANAYYFNNPGWAEEYLTYCHRSETFKSRWEAAIGDVSDKVVIDIGCGPGNIFATLSQKPKVLIGIDVAGTSLALAAKFGYLPVLADANDLPFKSGCADVVTLNAALHHCENMEAVLKEACRLVKPGGILITDHDPQYSAWNYKGLAKILWKVRLIVYKILGHGFHKSNEQQTAALASEIHHKPGHGVTTKLFNDVFKLEGFKVNIFPHNHNNGAEVLSGVMGKADMKYRLVNILSGRKPASKTSALSLMCVATKRGLVAVI
jgi:ubiquinone/menaquinone biosynthesis C-methylase UbiE